MTIKEKLHVLVSNFYFITIRLLKLLLLILILINVIIIITICFIKHLLNICNLK